MTSETLRPMRRLFSFLLPYRSQILRASSSSVSNKILDLMPPFLVGWIIDNLDHKAPFWMAEWLGIEGIWQGAIALSLGIILIFAFESLFEWWYQLGFKRMAQTVQHDLRVEVYDHLQSREIAYFERSRTGNLMSILNDDINQLERFLNTGFNDILQLLILVIFASLSLFAVSPLLALVGIAAIPFIILGSFYYQKLVAPRYKRMREAVGALASRLENNISGIMVIKSFSAEEFEKSRVAEASQEYKDANVSAIRLNAAYVPVLRIFIALGFAGCMLLGSYWYLEGIAGLTLGALTFFGMMIQRLLWPMTRLGVIFDEFERARASTRRIFELLDSKNPLRESQGSYAPSRAEGQLELNNVVFGYQDDLPIIRGMSLEIEAGQTIGIAGTTGAGKTTLIKLLMRLYDPQKGEILLDGQPLPAWDIDHLRQQIALVSQDTYLFHGTIAENIAYGTKGKSQADIEQVAREAQFHEFVQSLPLGYESIVGERGIRLSGGQRQRLSIARALLKNAPILILDEATSSVDSETEKAIQENLNRLVSGRTALIIAHRLSTIRQADRIIVLKDGDIAESGSHESLLLRGGIYAGLWKVQLGEIV
ncbi:MAG: ABC transporter ATP-binding protein/permease [Bacteroidia bacterium]|nr:ABC transporter ATP-binding protein/permease [Bacteroidia bacterium]